MPVSRELEGVLPFVGVFFLMDMLCLVRACVYVYKQTYVLLRD